MITKETRAVARVNRGGNLTQAFDLLANECLSALPSDETMVAVDRSRARLSFEVVAANNVSNADVNALAIAAETAGNNTTRVKNVLEVVLHAIYTVYAVLHHLIWKVLPRNEKAQTEIMSQATVHFAYQLFIKLFTTVMAPRQKAVRVNTGKLAAVPQARANGKSDAVGRLVLSALVVKRRLEVELGAVQSAIRQGSALVEALVENMGKNNAMAGVHNQEVLNTINVLSNMQKSQAYFGASKAVINMIVNAATTLHDPNRGSHNGQSKALLKNMVIAATKLQVV